ncbi:unnamed protein product [Angiostrongylus costaricensis]|uniref:UDP-N-acetylglucosamine transferase subunit ALG14 n=1 Tax=Angiostrongylus costaricensis TaxID=334426 RepID=A0A158PIX6_ANGCS|nr:unnamed protein product [Angiostrongylus costaricensis]
MQFRVLNFHSLKNGFQMVFVLFFSTVGLVLWTVFLATAYLCYLVRHSNQRSNFNRRLENISVCCVMGSGGHTMEMIELLKTMGPDYNRRCYIIADTDRISKDKVIEFESLRGSGSYEICFIPRSREVGQGFLTAIPKTLYSFIFALKTVWKTRPDLVITNGPGSCIPVVFAAAFFDMIRLRDIVIIYEESICRVESLSLSGWSYFF